MADDRRMRAPSRSLLALVLVVLLALACALGCGSTPDEPGSFIEFEAFPSTRILEAADLASLTAVTEDGELRFAGSPPALADVAVGRVLVSGASPTAPHGLMRVVLGVERTDRELVLRTAAAPPQLAFKRLHARSSGSLDPSAQGAAFVPSDSSPLALRPRWSLASGNVGGSSRWDIVVFDGDGDTATDNDQVRVEAALGGAVGFDLRVDVDWGDVDELPARVSECIANIAKLAVGERPSCAVEDMLPEAKLSFEADPSLGIDVRVVGAATLSFEKDFDVGTVELAPIALGPLVLVPTADIVARVEGGASARFDVATKLRARGRSYVGLSSRHPTTPDVRPLELDEPELEATTPKLDLHAQASASVGLRLGVSLYGVAGPYAMVSGVAELRADPTRTPCWDLRFAVEASLGVRITTPRLPLLGYVTLFDWKMKPLRALDRVIASGACGVATEGSPPPGGGPGAQALQAPSFATWAKVLGGPVDGSYVPSIVSATTAFPSLAPSIDGRWLFSGAGTTGLFKVDELGATTWTSRLMTQADRPVRPLATVPAADAGILALLRPEDDSAFGLGKFGQSGALAWTRGYALPESCVPRVGGLARDARDGFVVVGTCQGPGHAWAVHVDARGEVVRARLFSDASAIRMVPSAITRSEGELFVAGQLVRTPGQDLTFFMRLDDEERTTSSGAHYICGKRLGTVLTGAIPSKAGGVTLIGEAVGLGFVGRLRRDGSLGFATFPNTGTGVAAGFTPNAVVELPTTGIVIAATSGYIADPVPPRVVLLGLDGAGRTLWGQRYDLPGRAMGWPGLGLTDDGGLLVAAAAGPADGRDGDLVAMKVHARDGHLAEGTAVTTSPFAPGEYTCTHEPQSFAPAIGELAVETRSPSLARR